MKNKQEYSFPKVDAPASKSIAVNQILYQLNQNVQ